MNDWAVDFHGTWTDSRPAYPEIPTPLAERRVGIFEASRADRSPGRRLRAFALLVRGLSGGRDIHVLGRTRLEFSAPPTYGAFLELIDTSPDYAHVRAELGDIPLRCREGREISLPLAADTPWNPELHHGLQDLGYQIGTDVSLACEAFDNPALHYPGVDDGIAPVPDDHVHAVIAAIQRELNRERRPSRNVAIKLPPAPLAELPWHVQRALAERRRLRFKQWGITNSQWEANRWSLWDIPVDREWAPAWSRLEAAAAPHLRPAA